MGLTVSNRTLRESTGPELATYFRELLQYFDNKTISDHLLDGVYTGSLPPRVVVIWLSFADNSSLRAALNYEHSLSVRRAAIRRFSRRLRDDDFEEVWNAVGGTHGLLQLFIGLSVIDVAMFCRKLGRTGTWVIGRDNRRLKLTELATALASEHFATAVHKNLETRPLMKYYSRLVPACTEELIRRWQDDDALPKLDHQRLYEAHPSLMQKQCLENLKVKREKFDFTPWKPLFRTTPSLSATEQLSSSADFSIRVLKIFEADNSFEVEPHLVFQQVGDNVLYRLERRKATRDIRAGLIQTIVACIQARPAAAEKLWLLRQDLIGYAIRLWARHPSKYNDLLISVAQLLVSGDRGSGLASVVSLTLEVPRRLRYGLLVLLMQHLPWFCMNLQTDQELKNFEEVWPVDTFLWLAQTDARVLLERLTRLKPAGDFIKWQRRYDHSIFAMDQRNDPALLHIYLSRDVIGNVETARKVIDERRKQAATSREQIDRAFWAKSSLFVAIASGSLELYREMVLWIRRFNRDALTVKELYSSQVIATNEGLEILCAIPGHPKSSRMSAEEIKARVMTSNEIMLLFQATSIMVLREPSFSQHDWQPMQDLFGAVATQRMDRSKILQDTLQLSDKRLYEIVHHETLENLLKAETIGLQDGHERLQMRALEGPLGEGGLYVPDHALCPATYEFLDVLARRRDALWERYRRGTHPATVSLQRPWTKGLPIQDLFPLITKITGYGQYTPYLLHRAESVIFMPPNIALDAQPDDAETKEAIGPFVDDFVHALRFYANASAEAAARKLNSRKAWNHAFQKLTGDRMSQTEAIHFWQDVFRRADVEAPVTDNKEPEPPDPAVPDADDLSEPTEWNPDPQPERWVTESRELPQVNLDCLLKQSSYPWRRRRSLDASTTFENNKSSTIRMEQKSLWTRTVPSKFLHPKGSEALIAIAMLYVNDQQCSRTRILAKPFPSTEDPRFPALFLDQEFLERQDVSRNLRADMIISNLRNDVPPTLLVQLYKAMLNVLLNSERPSPSAESQTFFLLKELVLGDRPQLALDFVRQIIVERPNDSSWHRHLLTKGLLNSLPAARARLFLHESASGIQERLQKQITSTAGVSHGAEREVGASEESAGKSNVETQASTPPAVKVTTIKFLAQMMSSAEFLDKDTSVDVLAGLFAVASHLDIRVAIVESLVSILTENPTSNMSDKIMGILELHAIPVAASLNERRTMTEDDWAEAESSSQLPEVYHSSHGLPPVLQALLTASSDVPSSVTKMFVKRILLPILDISAQNNRRWTKLFLRDHTLAPSDLPLVPVRADLLVNVIVEHTEIVPIALLDIWASSVLIRLEPSQALIDVNSNVRESSQLRNSNGGKHWLSLWDSKTASPLRFGGIPIHSLLFESFEPGPDGITYEKVMDIVFKQAEVLIMRGGERLTELDWLVRAFTPPFGRNEETWKLWNLYQRPLIGRFISKIESLRTPQWQRDPDRKPAILRETYLMRLWLLTHPNMPWTAEHSGRLRTFATEISSEIDSLASAGFYHQKFEQLKVVALRVRPVDYCYLASRLGSLDNINAVEPSIADLLRIELADAFLQSAETPKDASDSKAARDVLLEWRQSFVEDIRMKGLRTIKACKEKEWFKAAV